MKTKELLQARGKSVTDLTKLIGEKQKELVKAKLEFRVGKVKNIRTMRTTRLAIAQLLTIMQEKKLQKEALS